MIRPYSPKGTEAANTSPELGIILYPPLGSTVDQDTGRDAQDLANTLGTHVIAVDRPGNGSSLPSRKLAKSLELNYGKEVLQKEDELSRMIAAEGLKNVTVMQPPNTRHSSFDTSFLR